MNANGFEGQIISKLQCNLHLVKRKLKIKTLNHGIQIYGKRLNLEHMLHLKIN